jgi:hypothetical protein
LKFSANAETASRDRLNPGTIPTNKLESLQPHEGTSWIFCFGLEHFKFRRNGWLEALNARKALNLNYCSSLIEASLAEMALEASTSARKCHSPLGSITCW